MSENLVRLTSKEGCPVYVDVSLITCMIRYPERIVEYPDGPRVVDATTLLKVDGLVVEVREDTEEILGE